MKTIVKLILSLLIIAVSVLLSSCSTNLVVRETRYRCSCTGEVGKRIERRTARAIREGRVKPGGRLYSAAATLSSLEDCYYWKRKSEERSRLTLMEARERAEFEASVKARMEKKCPRRLQRLRALPK